MNIYPAIDLKSGECVRLTQGCYDQVTVYKKDPLSLAKQFAQQGANLLHIVDLDGAKQGHSVNLAIIEKIAKNADLKVQTGGGIRTKQQLSQLLKLGISRVVLGSLAISQPHIIKEFLQEFGNEHIVLALDIRFDQQGDPKLALHGWQTPSEKNLWELLDEYQDSTLKHVLCTDIQRDGTMQGPNISLYQQCVQRFPNLQFQASGGISALSDLSALQKIPVASVIIGKALYDNKFSLDEAIEKVKIC